MQTFTSPGNKMKIRYSLIIEDYRLVEINSSQNRIPKDFLIFCVIQYGGNKIVITITMSVLTDEF